MTFVTKDSGERAQLGNGMVRDVETGKLDFTLMLDGPMFVRWVGLLNRGAMKYTPRNWMLALLDTNPETRAATTERFRRSALRHMIQWARGETDEDHAAAVFFNLNGYEAMRETEPK